MCITVDVAVGDSDLLSKKDKLNLLKLPCLTNDLCNI